MGFMQHFLKKFKAMEKRIWVVEVYITELIYSRVMCLLSVDQISLEDLFN